MQLAPTTTASHNAWHDRAGTIRRGAEAVPGVIAQALVELPHNFGMHGLIDVSIGRELGEFDTLEAARDGARLLASEHGLPTVGIVRRVDGDGTEAMRAVELLVPDFSSAPFPDDPATGEPSLPGWDEVRPTPLRLGRDPERGGRFVEDLRTIDRDGQPWLVEVATPSGVRLEFEHGTTPRVRTSRVEFG